MRIVGVIVILLVAAAAMPAVAEISTGLSGGGAGAQSQSADNVGKVVEMIPGKGRYSYLKLEHNGRQFWVAGVKVEAKKGDRVRYQTSVVMENFTSRELNRTFDEIIFASSIEVMQ